MPEYKSKKNIAENHTAGQFYFSIARDHAVRLPIAESTCSFVLRKKTGTVGFNRKHAMGHDRDVSGKASAPPPALFSCRREHHEPAARLKR
jgi:hypothetical protein